MDCRTIYVKFINQRAHFGDFDLENCSKEDKKSGKFGVTYYNRFVGLAMNILGFAEELHFKNESIYVNIRSLESWINRNRCWTNFKSYYRISIPPKLGETESKISEICQRAYIHFAVHRRLPMGKSMPCYQEIIAKAEKEFVTHPRKEEILKNVKILFEPYKYCETHGIQVGEKIILAPYDDLRYPRAGDDCRREDLGILELARKFCKKIVKNLGDVEISTICDLDVLHNVNYID